MPCAPQPAELCASPQRNKFALNGFRKLLQHFISCKDSGRKNAARRGLFAAIGDKLTLKFGGLTQDQCKRMWEFLVVHALVPVELQTFVNTEETRRPVNIPDDYDLPTVDMDALLKGGFRARFRVNRSCRLMMVCGMWLL